MNAESGEAQNDTRFAISSGTPKDMRGAAGILPPAVIASTAAVPVPNVWKEEKHWIRAHALIGV
jgi:hypothetical protein